MDKQKLQPVRRIATFLYVLMLALCGMFFLSACTASPSKTQAYAHATPSATTVPLSAIMATEPLTMGEGWQNLLTAHNTTSSASGTTVQETIGKIAAKKTFAVLVRCQGAGTVHVEVVSRGTANASCSATAQPIYDQFSWDQNPPRGAQYAVRIELEGQTDWAFTIATPKDGQ